MAVYVTKFFGPLIKIVGYMMIDIGKFFFLLAIVFFIFCFGGMLAFKKITAFNNF